MRLTPKKLDCLFCFSLVRGGGCSSLPGAVVEIEQDDFVALLREGGDRATTTVFRVSGLTSLEDDLKFAPGRQRGKTGIYSGYFEGRDGRPASGSGCGIEQERRVILMA